MTEPLKISIKKRSTDWITPYVVTVDYYNKHEQNWCITEWGARRWVRKMAKRIVKADIVTHYEFDTVSGQLVHGPMKSTR